MSARLDAAIDAILRDADAVVSEAWHDEHPHEPLSGDERQERLLRQLARYLYSAHKIADVFRRERDEVLAELRALREEVNATSSR